MRCYYDIIQQINKIPNKILLEDKIIGNIHVKYWIHEVNNIEIKNDYILLQTNGKDGKIIKYEKQWRDIQKTQDNVSQIKFDDTDIAWKKPVIFLEENDLNYFYSVDSDQEFPLLCSEIRYIDGKTDLINPDGKKIGVGVPAPSEYKGFSLSGYCQTNSPDYWIHWRQNADSWFQKWCTSTVSLSLPSNYTISTFVSNSKYYLFYELAHGNSTLFQSDFPGHYYFSSDLKQDMANREKMIFSFIGSCDGMKRTGKGTFSYEFRKGSMDNTVTIGYSGMGICPGWCFSIQWQDFMFYAMNANFTIKDAFNLACAEYPTIADCVVFVGDSTLKIVEEDQENDGIRPNVFFTYPSENSVVYGTIHIAGNADDLDGNIIKVYIKIDNGDWQEASGTEIWEFPWDTTTVSDGLHTITAVAKDDNGSLSISKYLNVYVVNDFLNTNIYAPEKALTNQEISFQSTTTGGILPYNYTWDFDDGTISYEQNPIHIYKKEKEYHVRLTVTDYVNNIINDTADVLVFENDDIIPMIELIKPQNAFYLANNKLFSLPIILVIGDITVQAEISDLGGSGLEKVEFYLDDNLKETFTDGTLSIYQWKWEKIAFFKHKITIKAYDNAGNINTKDIDIFKFG